MSAEWLGSEGQIKALENRYFGLDERLDESVMEVVIDSSELSKLNLGGTGVLLHGERFRKLNVTKQSWWLSLRKSRNQITE